MPLRCKGGIIFKALIFFGLTQLSQSAFADLWYPDPGNGSYKNQGPWELTQMAAVELWEDHAPLWDDDGKAYFVRP